MLTGWKQCLLGDVLTLQRGFDITKKEQKQGYVPVISSSGINSFHDTAKVNGPGVIIGRKGSLGTVFYIEENYWPHDTTLWIKDFHGNLPKFTYYFLSTLNLAHFDAGASNPTLNRNHVHLLTVYWPPLSTQYKIAAILSAYDDLIKNNSRRIAILEEMAQALYREWFVHFRYPGYEKNGMVESALGMIPEGWEVVKFTDIANILSGGTPKTHISEFWNGLIPFFTPKDAVKSFYVTETEKSITESGLKNCSSRLYPKNTVFITARGTVGKVLLSGMDMAMNQSCYALQGRDNIDQLFIFLTTRNYIDQLKQKSHGAVFDTIIVDTFKLLDIVKPPLDLIGAFCPFISPIFENVLNLINKNINLRRTRDLLLPKLISGEVDVEGLDIETDEATSEAAASIEEEIEKSAEAALAGEQGTLWEQLVMNEGTGADERELRGAVG